MRITYFALKPLRGLGWTVQPGDLVPQANSWTVLSGYVNEGQVAPVLVDTLPEDAQSALERYEETGEWDFYAERDKEDVKAAEAAYRKSHPAPPEHVSGADEDNQPPSDDPEEVESYDEFTVEQLKKELDEREVPYKSSDNKSDLIDRLEKNDEYEDQTVELLKHDLDSRGVEYKASAHKADLIKLLEDDDNK
jgi:hypothetical protein